MNKTFIIILIILILISFGYIMQGITPGRINKPLKVQIVNSSNCDINAEDGDRYCEADKDCTLVRCECGVCGRSSVNLKFKEKYDSLYDSVCRGVAEAPVSCQQFKVGCMSNKCALLERTAPIVPDDRNSCVSMGGKWGAFDWTGRNFCIVPTQDAGKSCTDASQCESSCLAPGKCAEWFPLSKGCYSFVENGEVKLEICTDD